MAMDEPASARGEVGEGLPPAAARGRGRAQAAALWAPPQPPKLPQPLQPQLSASQQPPMCQQLGEHHGHLMHLSQLSPGLQNLGNTCYLNSALQALASSAHVRRYVLALASSVQQLQEQQQAQVLLQQQQKLPQRQKHWTLGVVQHSSHGGTAECAPRRPAEAAKHGNGATNAEISSPQAEGSGGESTTNATVSNSSSGAGGVAPSSSRGCTPPLAQGTGCVWWRRQQQHLSDMYGSAMAAAGAALEQVWAPTARNAARAVLWASGWEPQPRPPASAPAAHPFHHGSAPVSPSPLSAHPSTRPTAPAMSPEARRLARCRLLLPLSHTLAALQPRYTPAGAGASAPASSGATTAPTVVDAAPAGHHLAAAAAAAAPPAAAAAAVDPYPVLRALRALLPEDQLQLGLQHDAAEALECLCDALSDEAAAWGLLYGRWLCSSPGEVVRQELTASATPQQQEQPVELGKGEAGRGAMLGQGQREGPVGGCGGAGVCSGSGCGRGGSCGAGGLLEGVQQKHIRLARGEQQQQQQQRHVLEGPGAEQAQGLEALVAVHGVGRLHPGLLPRVPLRPVRFCGWEGPASGAPPTPGGGGRDQSCLGHTQDRQQQQHHHHQMPVRGYMAHTTTCCSCGNSAPTQLQPFWTLQLPLPAAHVQGSGGPRNVHPSPSTPPFPHATALAQGFGVLDPQQSIPPSASFSSHAQGHSGLRHAGGSVPLRSCLRGVAKEELVEGVACAKCTLVAALRDPDIATLLRHVQRQGQQEREQPQPVDFLQPPQQQGEHPQQPSAPPPEVRTGSRAAGPVTGAAVAAGAAAEALLRQAAALAAVPSLVPLPDLGDLDSLLASLSSLRHAAPATRQHQQPESAATGGTSPGPTRPQPGALEAAATAAATGALPGTLSPLPRLRVVRRRALRGSHVALLPRVLVLQLLRSVWDPRVGAPVKDGRHVAFPMRLGREDLALLKGQRQPHRLGQHHDGKPHHQQQQQQQHLLLLQDEAVGALAQQNGGHGTEQWHEGREQAHMVANDGGLSECTGCGDERYAPYTLTAVVVHYGGASSGHYLMYRRVPAAVCVGATLGGSGAVSAGVGGQVHREAVAVGPACGGAAAGGGTGRGGALGAAEGDGGRGGGHGSCVWLRVSDSSVRVVQEGEVLRQVAALLVYERG